ncbi:response regulator transcription factor [Eggerthella sp. YY7918]|uniref:response regulator transcription factor n=1 Tax=Eggerthella sp. (strain YY7918) TaxID=502558 RepID=UPI0002F02B52|nr:helix-turn-helix transcriptional regulator [Eggerthella sp. YY7918]
MKKHEKLLIAKARISLGDKLQIIASLALFFIWWQILFFSFPLQTMEFSISDKIITRGNMAWIAFMVAFLISALTVRVFFNKRGCFFHLRPTAVVGGLMSTFGSVLLLFSDGVIAQEISGGLLAGVGVFGLLLPFFLYLVNLTLSNRLVIFIYSSLASGIAAALLLVVPSSLIMAITCMLPILTSLLLESYLDKRRTAYNCSVDISSTISLDETESERISLLQKKSGIWICAFIILLTYFYTSITGGIAEEIAPDQLLSTSITQCSLSATLVFIFLCIVRRSLKSTAIQYYCFLSVGMALLIASCFQNHEGILVSNVIVASNRLLMMLLLCNELAEWLKQTNRSPLQTRQRCCTLLLLIPSCALLSEVIGIAVVSQVGLGSTSISVIATIVLFFVFVLQGVLFYSKEQIEVVVRGKIASESEINSLRSEALQHYCESLSDRETEIIALILTGMNAKSIAQHLTISENTAKSHIQHIYTKLEIHSKQELLMLANNITRVDERDQP